MHIDLQAGLLELVHPGAPPVALLFLRSRRSSPSPPSSFQSGPSSSLEAGDVATPVWARRLMFLVQSQQDQLQKAREETTGSGRLRSRHSGLYALVVFRDNRRRHPGHVFVADDNQIGPSVCLLLPTATQDQHHPQRRPSEGGPSARSASRYIER